MTIQQTICNMLTENTGTHMLDSGGEGGRNWQQNQGLTVAALEAAPVLRWKYIILKNGDMIFPQRLMSITSYVIA